MHRGFITLHRKIVEWEWYSDANVFRVFTHLILTANWEPKKWQGILVERGQKITSIQHIAEETGLTPQSVRTAIKKLKSTGELTSKSTNRYTLITLTNYDFYQDKENQLTNKTTSNLTNEQQTTNKQLTTTKQLNKETIKTINKDHVAKNCDASVKTEKSVNEVEIPTNLNTPEFLQAWEEWQSYRKQTRKTLTVFSIKKQLGFLSSIGVQDAIISINESIKNGYTGLFPVKQAARNKNNSGFDAIEWLRGA
jgi:DNA-binding transcriptional regulator YhcF (GntR family)